MNMDNIEVKWSYKEDTLNHLYIAMLRVCRDLRDMGYEGKIEIGMFHKNISTDFGVLKMDEYHIAGYHKKTGILFSEFPRDFARYYMSPEKYQGEDYTSTEARRISWFAVEFLAGKWEKPWGPIIAW